MTASQQPNRFRLRFSIRTLIILVTLVCCYAACWGPTKKWGVVDVYHGHPPESANYRNAAPVAPLVVSQYNNLYWERRVTRSYYFWFFGYTAKLPYEREWELESAPTFIPYDVRRDR
jgi:hypothetical protein